MDDFEQYLEYIRQKYHLPALAMAISQDGQPDRVAACGIRKAGEATAVTKRDTFHFGSCGKAITAALIHTLVEQGKLGRVHKIPSAA